MRTAFCFLFFLQCTIATVAQQLYAKTFGNPSNPAIVYLHGGPGYNCANFEVTTAAKLADKGFFVVVYDRRGEGRSADAKAQYSFQESCGDLVQLLDQFKISKATLMGHSFGGMVAVRFAQQFPSRVSSVVLVGAPVSLQASFRTIIASSKRIYAEKKDSVSLNYVKVLVAMDTNSIEYSTYCFSHAMRNGFYSPKQKSEEAKALYALFKTDSVLMKYASKMTIDAPRGFWKNDHYTTIDLTRDLEVLVKSGLPVYGLYGKEDGLYSPEQMQALEAIVGKEHFAYLADCSHNVFVDQPTLFFDRLSKWLK